MSEEKSNSVEEKVSYHESPIFEVRKDLKEKGYITGSFTGLRNYFLSDDSIALLKHRESNRKGLLGLLGLLGIKTKQRALFIGTLWLDNESRKAKLENRWVLEVYGRENIQELTDLANEFSKQYNVNVQITLREEYTRLEEYLSDGAM